MVDNNNKSSQLSPWIVGLLTFCLGLALRGSDPLHLVLSKLYPTEDSVGGIEIEMRDVPGAVPLNQRANIFLVRHEFEGEETITLIRRGAGGSVEHILAGISERAGSATIPTGGLNHDGLLEMQLPPNVLVAASIMTSPTQTDTSIYSLATARAEKKFLKTGDLIVMTANEERNIRLLYWLTMIMLFFVGLGVSRFTKLSQPTQ